MAHVTDNTGQSRFETTIEGITAFLEYRLQAGNLVLVHTEVPATLGGKGVGSILATGALDAAQLRGIKVVAECEFVAAYIQRHPAYQDLLAPG
jgi:predicted GNAT family acetyltransferase